MGTWVGGYGFYDLIPISSFPGGYDIFPFIILSHILTSIGFLPGGHLPVAGPGHHFKLKALP
jgi:hypothetical protein